MKWLRRQRLMRFITARLPKCARAVSGLLPAALAGPAVGVVLGLAGELVRPAVVLGLVPGVDEEALGQGPRLGPGLAAGAAGPRPAAVELCLLRQPRHVRVVTPTHGVGCEGPAAELPVRVPVRRLFGGELAQLVAEDGGQLGVRRAA